MAVDYGRIINAILNEDRAKVWSRDNLIAEAKFINDLSRMQLPQIRRVSRITKFNDFDGDEVDLDRLRVGQPFWRKSQRELSHAAHEVTVVTEVNGGPYTSIDLLWRGAAAIALTYILESLGYRVELWAASCHEPSLTTERLITATCLKRHGDTLDIGANAAIVSGWVHRTMRWTLIDTRWSELKIDQTVGCPCTARADELAVISPDENLIFSHGVFSYYAAEAMIQLELQRIADRT